MLAKTVQNHAWRASKIEPGGLQDGIFCRQRSKICSCCSSKPVQGAKIAQKTPKIALEPSQTLQNHGRGPPKSSREASRTASSVASALKSTLVEVQNQFKAPRSPKRYQKSQFDAQMTPNLSQHGSNLEAQTLPN